MRRELKMYIWVCDVCNHEGDVITTHQRPKLYDGWKIVTRGTDPFTTKHIAWGNTALLCPACFEECQQAKAGAA